MKLLLLVLSLSTVFAMDIVVPAYFYPSNFNMVYWNGMADSAAKGLKLTVIFTPSPKDKNVSDYVNACNLIRGANGTLLAYVDSNYAKISLSVVQERIANYKKWYNPHGFFIDQMSSQNSAEDVIYYQKIYTYVKNLGSKLIVVNNPGNAVKDIYLNTKVADRFMSFEGTHQSYITKNTAEPNNKSSFIHCVYNVTESEMANDLARAQERKADGIYLTQKNSAECRYSSLPSYWNKLVTAVNKINGST